MTVDRQLLGLAASPGCRRGPARVVDTADLATVAHGDVLVTRAATPDVVLVFDRIVALVTDQGGRSAHASIVARAMGIPAVVGTQTATQAVTDGSLLEVDGSRGTVTIQGEDTSEPSPSA